MDPETTLPSTIPSNCDELTKAAMECYFSAILAMGAAAAEICPHIGAPYASGLVRLRRRLAFETTPRNLAESLTALETDMAAFAHRVSEYFTLKTGDIGGLLELVSQAIETFEMRDGVYLERLGLMVRQMESGLQGCRDSESLRPLYEHQLAQLRMFVERLAADRKKVFDELQASVAEYEERLLRAEAEASLDPLTSLVNRRELERLIRDRIERGTTFSLLLFDIRSLRIINERFGQEAGDQILRQFGARLVAQVRPRDIVSRWGGDEFAVIFDCGAEGANSRARQIAQWVSGRYPVSVSGQDWKPEIEAEVYVIEHRAAESEGSFLARVNAFRLVSDPRPVEVPAGPDEISPENWRMM